MLLAFHPAREVGVDVEAVRRLPEMETFSRQILATEELRGWLKLAPMDRLPALYQAWTRHEAVLKAMGIGGAGERPAALPAGLSLFDLALPAGYQGAAACLNSTAAVGLHDRSKRIL